jgi:hypothetical protein
MKLSYSKHEVNQANDSGAMCLFACQSKQWHDQTPVHENNYKAQTSFMNK